MKDYGFIFREDKELSKKAKVISELTKDISEYIFESLKLDIKDKGKKYKVAYHSACSMQHGQKIHSQPKELISNTGNEVLEIPEGHLCCGSAGTYNILHQKMAKSLLRNKVNNIEKISPDFISRLIFFNTKFVPYFTLRFSTVIKLTIFQFLRMNYTNLLLL